MQKAKKSDQKKSIYIELLEIRPGYQALINA
jgi:hypothetical protein